MNRVLIVFSLPICQSQPDLPARRGGRARTRGLFRWPFGVMRGVLLGCHNDTSMWGGAEPSLIDPVNSTH